MHDVYLRNAEAKEPVAGSPRILDAANRRCMWFFIALFFTLYFIKVYVLGFGLAQRIAIRTVSALLHEANNSNGAQVCLLYGSCWPQIPQNWTGMYWYFILRQHTYKLYYFFLLIFFYVTKREHAFRCYSAALKVYEGSGWSLVEGNVNYSLGRLAFYLGDIKASYRFFRSLLASNNQAMIQQTSYLNEFCRIYRVCVLVFSWNFQFALSHLHLGLFVLGFCMSRSLQTKVVDRN